MDCIIIKKIWPNFFVDETYVILAAFFMRAAFLVHQIQR